MDSVPKSDLISWIEKSLKNEDISNCDISIVGKAEVGDGYVGEIIFANVVGATRDNHKKELDLVVKHSKPNIYLRQQGPMKQSFETEIHFYTKLIPAFCEFQKEHKVKEIFDSVPKCYATFMLDNMEAIVLDNLKKLGYDLHDRKKPMNFEHQRLVLTAYGKMHALSFAFQDQRPKEFNDLIDRPAVPKELFKMDPIKESFMTAVDEAVELLEKRGDSSLAEKLKKVLYKPASDIIVDYLYEDIPQSVITHGDCWNNNFMYKYENNDRSSPSKVMILDWQLSVLRSPVFDVSQFIYSTSSTEQLNRFEELLGVYYRSLSSFIRQLGSDPDQLFPYSALKTHWKKYSIYGMLYMPLLMKFVLCDKDEAPDMGNLNESTDMSSVMRIDMKDTDLYYERLKPSLMHYFEYESMFNN